MQSSIRWPDGKRFAFTIFDDPDSQTAGITRSAYGVLRDLGLRTTKGIWPVRGPREPSDHGETCSEPEYRKLALELQESGFEIGLHCVTSHTSTRDETAAGLDRFAEMFGADPKTLAMHYYCDENLYWGEDRLSGWRRTLYNVLTRGSGRNKYFGHVEGHRYFWGDLCRSRIAYVRNFVFADINTLNPCPFFPYHDPERPYVRAWFCSTEGSNVQRATAALSEENQDRLEAEGGACILYTHFGHGYVEGGSMNARFSDLITRLSRKNGWFVPVGTLLDYMAAQHGGCPSITAPQRAGLERTWLFEKMRRGTS